MQNKQVFTDKNLSQKLRKDNRFDFFYEFWDYLGLVLPKKTATQKLVVVLELLVVFGLALLIFVNLPSLVNISNKGKSAKEASASAKLALTAKADNKVIQGNVLAIDLSKKEIRILGQANTAVVLTTLEFNPQFQVKKILFDIKTQKELSSSLVKLNEIKINDIIRVTAKKDITSTIKESDVSQIEILRSK